MGKASRKKKQQTPEDRRAAEAARQVRSYFSRVGAVQPTNRDQFWSGVESRLGSEFAEELDRLLTIREQHPEQSEVYELLYRDLDTLQATLALLAPMARDWLTRFATLQLPPGDLLDVGSGHGFNTCFYALARPDHGVVGVEQSKAGVAAAVALANHLGLENVEFVHGDVRDLQLDRQFRVICSTAVFGEVDRPLSDESAAFSSLSSGRDMFATQESAVARFVSDHLLDDGVYVSLERLSNFENYAGWFGALQRNGFDVDLTETRPLRWNGPLHGEETMPVIITEPGESALTFDVAVQWQLGRAELHDESFEAECSLAFSTNVEFVAGHHFEIEDTSGAGETRVYVLIADDEAVVYMTTNRGYRMIHERAEASDVNRCVDVFNGILTQFSGAPAIVSARPLAESDLFADLDRRDRAARSLAFRQADD